MNASKQLSEQIFYLGIVKISMLLKARSMVLANTNSINTKSGFRCNYTSFMDNAIFQRVAPDFSYPPDFYVLGSQLGCYPTTKIL